MIQHSAMNRSRMMDLIERAIEASDPQPSDAEIAEHFGFASEEASRTLLADLADRGLITIRGAGSDRQIALGKATRYQAPAVEPIRPIARQGARKAAVSKAAVARIMDIARHPATAAAAPPAPPAAVRERKPAAAEGQVIPAPAPAEPIVTLERKPLVRAAMVAACQRDGFPLDSFVRMLLERGFASYEADAAAERAA